MRSYLLLPFFALIGVSLVCAETVPGRYIVELDETPVAVHVARQGIPRGVHPNLLGTATASAQRDTVHRQQQLIGPQLAARHAHVVGSLDTLINGLVVTINDAEAGNLASIPGVLRVVPVRVVKPQLDRAVLLHRVSDVWARIGKENAGAGVKVGIIDTGIDLHNPAFQDSSLVTPGGFPVIGADATADFVSNKVIVSRSYVRELGTDPDYTPADDQGHGTFVAMIVAGGSVNAPLATISGLAPKAFLGNYKVFGSPKSNDNTTDDVVIQALEDAVKDGMDIVNLSLGAPAERLSADLEVSAVEHASSLGVLVTVAGGNLGPDGSTVTSPGSAPSAITVGASYSDRDFRSLTQVNGQNFVSAPGSNPVTGKVTGPLADISPQDPSGLACSALPAGSLTGKIALIFRGTCTFESKLNNVAAGGALGALVYTNANPVVTMAEGAATLPALMISNADGLSLKQQLQSNPGISATLNFNPTAVPAEHRLIANFSSIGPNVDLSIKPDLVATGVSVYSAAQTANSAGEVYDPSGFTVADGTSFAAPMVAGALAVLKSAKPGLTGPQYRSLVINSAAPFLYPDGSAATIQTAGAGLLDAFAASQAAATSEPAELNFGAAAAPGTQTVTLSNISGKADTFSIRVTPLFGLEGPAAWYSTVALDAGAELKIPVAFPAPPSAPGPYQGYVRVTSANTGAELRIPYWFAVPGSAQAIAILDTATSLGKAGSVTQNAILFRFVDSAGVPVTGITPTVTVSAGDGSINRLSSVNSQIPAAWSVAYRVGSATSQTVHIAGGGLNRDVVLQ